MCRYLLRPTCQYLVVPGYVTTSKQLAGGFVNRVFGFRSPFAFWSSAKVAGGHIVNKLKVLVGQARDMAIFSLFTYMLCNVHLPPISEGE